MPRTNIKSAALPTDFDSLVQLHPPAAIHDEVTYENTMEMISRLTAVAKPTKGQLKYLDTLTILVERYEDDESEARSILESAIGYAAKEARRVVSDWQRRLAGRMFSNSIELLRENRL